MSPPGTEEVVEEIVVPDTVEELLRGEDVRPDRPWVVIVWNDPVNTFAYVIFVFQKLFGYSRAKARRLTNQVHYEGKAVVAGGAREKCEADVARLHKHGLWATMQKDE
jgi:ATP-dependent Clp protease adaptor protein ClpS